MCSSLPPYAISFVVSDTLSLFPIRRCWKVSKSIMLHLAPVSTFSSAEIPCTVLYSSLCQVSYGINILHSYSINEERFTFITVCLVWFNIVDGFGVASLWLVGLCGPAAFLKMVPLFAAIALLTICRTLISFSWVVTTAVVTVFHCWWCFASGLYFDLQFLYFPADAWCMA